MRAIRNFFANWWVSSILIVLLLIGVFAVGLPLFVTWLQPWWVRALVVGSVLLVWGILVFLRIAKRRKAAAAIAAELAQPPSAADEEGTALQARMAEAVASFKAASGGKRDYLYSRPWYVIIGPPGAGKTTALLNSGLRFPFAEQALKGVGGTRNLDFWFADEAVMVDTAGRYTTQDSDYEVDRKGWTSFLSLLKKHRPLSPINGVIVAIGLDELIRTDCAGIDAHAAAVRRRIAEMRATLEVSPPVYVMLTKADLIAGMTEYFADLDVEGRRAVFGHTFDHKEGSPGSEKAARAFDEMAQAIADRQAGRLLNEPDQARRSMLLGYPSQLQAIRSRLMRFMEGAFFSAKPAETGQLRGFYFTSGVQEGAPLDRILSSMADVYDRDQREHVETAGTKGKAYFLNRLLTEVMFKEAGLVSSDPVKLRRQRTRLTAAMAGIAAVSLVMLSLWGISFYNNRSFQSAMVERASAAEVLKRDTGVDMKEVRDGDADMRDTLPLLDALRALPRGYADQKKGGPPLMMTFGLYQKGLAEAGEEAYRNALRRVMLPRLLIRLEQYMQANGQDALALYEPLKTYLILGSQGPMDRKAVQSWIARDWASEVYPGADNAADRRKLEMHLAALLEDEELASAWPNRKAPLDGNVIAQARAAVQTLSMADRAYAVLRQKGASAGAPWRVSNILTAGDAKAFANGNDVLGAEVPFFFTRAGYEKAYLVGLATVQQDLERDLWMMGGDADKEGIKAEIGNIRPGVAGLYAKDYIAAWEAIIAKMQPGAYFADIAAYGAFTKSPSPLKRVLIELRKNTSFEGGMGAVAERIMRSNVSRNRFTRYADTAAAGRATGLDAAEEISNYFKPVHDYVGDGKSQAPIDEFVASVKDAGQAVIAARSVGGGGGAEATQAAMASAMASVAGAAAGAPPQLQGFVASATKGGSSAQTSAAQGAITDAYAQVVLPACREVAQDRYPFFGSATEDAAVAGMSRLFGLGGTLDGFVAQRLSPLIDGGGPVWRWKAGESVTAALDPSSPEEFSKAAEIRDLIVAGLPLKVSLAALGPDTGAVEIAVGGTSYRFDASGGGGERPLIWNAGGLPTASVTFYDTSGQTKTGAVEAEGPWALFRLVDKGRMENAGPNAIRVKWGEGARSAQFRFTLPGSKNPFSRGGLWSFRCPATL